MSPSIHPSNRKPSFYDAVLTYLMIEFLVISELYTQVWDMAKLGQQASCKFVFVNFFCLDQAITVAFIA